MASTSQPQLPTVAEERPKAKPLQAKRRWTREEKALRNKERQQQGIGDAPPSPSKIRTKPKKPKRIPVPLSSYERLLKCAKDAQFTGSVHYVESNEKQQLQDDDSIHISTYCRWKPPLVSKWIHVQPLLIFDLNGILCHRIRRPAPGNYRPSAAQIANTPIIARVDLISFLTFLDAHFTLAVWTSAKTKTAKQLVSLLFPVPIKERLLFIWGQPKCDTIHIEGREKPLYQKPLSRVWDEYPLWDTTNTLLMDDSPKKCPPAYSQNTLHPPPLHGQSSHHVMSDLENEKLQLCFFQQLVQELDDSGDINSVLERCGRGHMGWRGPSSLELLVDGKDS